MCLEIRYLIQKMNLLVWCAQIQSKLKKLQKNLETVPKNTFLTVFEGFLILTKFERTKTINSFLALNF